MACSILDLSAAARSAARPLHVPSSFGSANSSSLTIGCEVVYREQSTSASPSSRTSSGTADGN
jgi:hypothetical protein